MVFTHNFGLDRQVYQGREVFKVLFTKLNNQIKALTAIEDEKQKLKVAYKRFYDSNQATTGHYFRILNNALKFVDDKGVTINRSLNCNK